MACSVVLMAGCGSGNDYVDEMVSLSEEAVDMIEDAETQKDLLRVFQDIQDKEKKIEDEYADAKKEYERGVEDAEDDKFLDLQLLEVESQCKVAWAMSKKGKELQDKEKEEK